MKKSLALSFPLLTTASLFADEKAPARGQSMYQTFIMIGIALVFFYLILWRPEKKRRKKMEQQRNNLSKGDRVTAMGIVGTVFAIKETTLILKMVDGAKIEVLKAAISDVQPAATSQESAQMETSSPKTNGAGS